MQALSRDVQRLTGGALKAHEAFKIWCCFASCSWLLFWFFSSGDFSFILTLSSLVSLFSFVTVTVKIESWRTAQGISSRMMECYMLVFGGRLCAIVPFEGYLPFDKSGDWLYQVCEGLALCLAGVIVYQCRVRHAKTYSVRTDTLNNIWLILPAFLASLVIHPHLNNHLASDVAWAFALYLESVAVICQFFMFMNEGRAQPHTAHFLAAQALSKFMSFIFWSSSFSELTNPNHYSRSFVGAWVVGMQMVQILIMVDFIHNYLYCMWYGIPVARVCCSEENV
jgi:hypothetical protein